MDHANPLVGWILAGLLLLAAVTVIVHSGAENLSRTAIRIQE
jgi:hypothetical protein